MPTTVLWYKNNKNCLTCSPLVCNTSKVVFYVILQYQQTTPFSMDIGITKGGRPANKFRKSKICKFAVLNFCKKDLQTFCKCVNLQICLLQTKYFFGFANPIIFFGRLKNSANPQYTIFIPTNISLKCSHSNIRTTFGF